MESYFILLYIFFFSFSVFIMNTKRTCSMVAFVVVPVKHCINLSLSAKCYKCVVGATLFMLLRVFNSAVCVLGLLFRKWKLVSLP